MRNFVTGHLEYKQDSVVSDEICYVLLHAHACDRISRGELKCPDLSNRDSKPEGTLIPQFRVYVTNLGVIWLETHNFLL